MTKIPPRFVLVRRLLLMMSLCLCSLPLQAQLPDWTGQAGGTSIATSSWRRGFSVETTFGLVNQGPSNGTSPGALIRYQLIPNSGGLPITLSWRIREDTNLINGDRQLTFPGGMNNPSEITSFLVVPGSLANGSYTLRVFVDSDERLEESNETNNLFVLSNNITVISTPDLGFSGNNVVQVSGSNVIRDAGEQFTIATLVRNDGDLVNIPAFLASYYLVRETDPVRTTFSTDDAIFLGLRAVPAISTTAQINLETIIVSETFNLPSDLEFLNYRVGVVLDPTDEVTEYSEASNLRLSRIDEDITVRYVLERPDYQSAGGDFISMSPTTQAAGEFATFNGRIENSSGFSTSNITTVRHVIERHPSGTEIDLGTTLIPPIAPMSFHDFSVNLRIPANVFPNEYRYSFYIDDAGVVAERDEENNRGITFDPLLTVTEPILPDLKTEGNGQFAPETIASGGDLTVQAFFENAGFSATGSFRIDFVLSPDTTIGNGNDISIGSTTISAGLAADTMASTQPTLTLPENIPLGEYWVGWEIDAGEQVEELNEGNNSGRITSGRLIVTPDGNPLLADLAVGRMEPLTQVVTFEDESLIFDIVIENAGTADAGATQARVGLSLDGVIGNDDDVDFGMLEVPAIGAGRDTTVAVKLPLPDPRSLIAGNYQVIMTVDVTGAVAESLETNNSVLVPKSQVTVRPADSDDLPRVEFRERSLTPNPVIVGRSITHLAVLANEGKVAVGGLGLEVILSDDGTLDDADDLLLTRHNAILLDPEQEDEVFNRSIRIPDRLQPGGYTVFWRVTGMENLQEQGNGLVQSVSLTLREPRLTIRVLDPDPREAVIELSETDERVKYLIESSLNLKNWKESDPQQGQAETPLIFRIPGDGEQKKFFRPVILDN